MGFRSLVLVAHDDLREVAATPNFGVLLAAYCRSQEKHDYLPKRFQRGQFDNPPAILGSMTTHTDRAILALLDGRPSVLHDNLKPGEGVVAALAHAIASMKLSDGDRALLSAALTGRAPAQPDAEDQEDHPAGPWGMLIDGSKHSEFRRLDMPGAPIEVSITIPLIDGAGVKARFEGGIGFGGVAIELQVSVPFVEGDAASMRVEALPGSEYRTSHPFESLVDISADQLIEYLGKRFEAWPATEVGTMDQAQQALADAALVFGPEESGRDGESFCVVVGLHTGAYVDETGVGISISRGGAFPSWRLTRAVDLILAHFRPWGADLECRDGRIQPRPGPHFQTTAARAYQDPLDQLSLAEAEQRLWEFFRVEARMSQGEIITMFELQEGSNTFARS